MQQHKNTFFTKTDKEDIISSVYTANIIQLLATMGSVIAIIKFMMK